MEQDHRTSLSDILEGIDSVKDIHINDYAIWALWLRNKYGIWLPMEEDYCD